MYRTGRDLIFSPSDLIAFLENPDISWLDRYAVERPGELIPDQSEGQDEVIQSEGHRHEQSVLAQWKNEQEVVTIGGNDADPLRRTLEAMQAGAHTIYQARLEYEGFAGWADFLIRVDTPSALGDWSYEVWDTKLSRSMKPYFAVQLCCYAEMLGHLQGRLPETVGIILGQKEQSSLRLADYWFYYQAVKRDFLTAQDRFDPRAFPSFSGTAGYGRWQSHADKILEERDDLSLVANIRSSQLQKLIEAGISSMTELARTSQATVARLDPSVFARLKAQARLQLAAKPGAPPPYEMLPPDPENGRRGFALLPPPSRNDVCFDIEGYPLIEGGLEYLLGISFLDGNTLTFRGWWAHDQVQERNSFVGFVEWIYQRWTDDPSMHVFHYAPYETTALKRLMNRYAACQDELDELLRHHVFVDLYQVTRQALMVGERKYSLKNIERLYQPHRDGEVATAGDSIVYYHRWMNLRDGETEASSPTLKLIWDYNRVDCESTWSLMEWLRRAQHDAQSNYQPPAPPGEAIKEKTARAELVRQMLGDIPIDRASDPDRWRVHELLAHLLEFHRREDKAFWWTVFEHADMTEAELLNDRECLACAERTESAPTPVKKSLLYEYRFPQQESKVKTGGSCFLASDIDRRFTVNSIDHEAGILSVKQSKNLAPPPSKISLIPNEFVDSKVIDQSIEQVVRSYLETGKLPSALADLIFRRAPRSLFALNSAGALTQHTGARLRAVVTNLDSSALCVQGPPGSGKTCEGGRLIAGLLLDGKRIAVSSNSHNAICLLMNAAMAAYPSANRSVRAVKFGGDRESQILHGGIEHLEDDTSSLSEYQLVGGTAWLFSRPESHGQYDYLFVDEASQVCLAKVVAIAPCALNMILLGDPMQLGQPTKAVHPGDSGQSVLEYFLEGRATIPDHLGLFLPQTFRMRPELCELISTAFYEGRLGYDPSVCGRSLHLDSSLGRRRKSAGVAYVPVVHENRSCESPEEAVMVKTLVDELLGQAFETGEGMRYITSKDILVVAPFNVQVRRLQATLPGLRVGTVDKFQGEQAPIVIFSMTSSSGNESPRGIDFLFDRNRLNVALSRAQVLSIVVACPELERTRCSTLDQMRAVNAYCMAINAGRASGMEVEHTASFASGQLAAAML